MAPGEAGAAGGAGFGAGETLGARDSPRPGTAQAELSTTTRVSAPNRAQVTAHHLFVSGKQPCCKDQGRGIAPRNWRSNEQMALQCLPTLERAIQPRALAFLDRQNKLSGDWSPFAQAAVTGYRPGMQSQRRSRGEPHVASGEAAAVP